MLYSKKAYSLMIRDIAKLFTYLIMFGVFFSCSVDSTDELPAHIQSLENLTVYDNNTSPESSISIYKLTEFGNSEEVPIGRVSYVDVDDTGNVYLSEDSRSNHGIHVFDSDGNYLQKIGRSGEGPGEFLSIYDMKVYKNRLYVLDGSLLRIQFFNIDDYSLVDQASLTHSEWDFSGDQSMTFPEDIFVLSDSTLLASFNHLTFDIDTKSYYQIDYKGNVISDQIIKHDYITHFEDPGTKSYFYDPFGGRGSAVLSSNNNIYSSWSKEMLFKVYNSDGKYLRAFYHPFQNSQLSQVEALNYYESEQFKSALNNHGVPGNWRAFEHMIIDDENRLWISTIIDDQDVYKWWVMDRNGKILAKKVLPRTNEIKKVQNDIIYSVRTDEETGLQNIVKYDVEWGK